MAKALIEEAEALEDIAEEFGDTPRAFVYWELAAALRWDAAELER